MCVVAVCAGCSSTSREAQFGLIAGKDTGQNIRVPDVTNVPVTVGEVKGSMILFPILLPLSTATLQEAADDAMKKGAGNLIVDAEVESFTSNYFFFGGYGLRVKGKVVNVPK